MNARKVAIVGPECSGKSSLVKKLAKEYGTEWVPEYARFYLTVNGANYKQKDLYEIANKQLNWENEIGRKVKDNFLFCDTNLLVIIIWAKYVFNNVPREIESLYNPAAYDLHVLCKPDMEWEPDPLREHPKERDEIFEKYHQYLEQHKIPFMIAEGDLENRIADVKKKLSKLK
ncbi:MAG: ATPase [Chitinophagaceae bacterium]|nr:MAG: ATPase [Chitinophagaceae bacterium]